MGQEIFLQLKGKWQRAAGNSRSPLPVSVIFLLQRYAVLCVILVVDFRVGRVFIIGVAVRIGLLFN